MCDVVQLETVLQSCIFEHFIYFLSHSSHTNNALYVGADCGNFLVVANFRPSLLICMNNYNTSNGTLLPLLLEASFTPTCTLTASTHLHMFSFLMCIIRGSLITLTFFCVMPLNNILTGIFILSMASCLFRH